jgi:hypothetical protein
MAEQRDADSNMTSRTECCSRKDTNETRLDLQANDETRLDLQANDNSSNNDRASCTFNQVQPLQRELKETKANNRGSTC